jgi:hypothetical protein
MPFCVSQEAKQELPFVLFSTRRSRVFVTSIVKATVFSFLFLSSFHCFYRPFIVPFLSVLILSPRHTLFLSTERDGFLLSPSFVSRRIVF